MNQAAPVETIFIVLQTTTEIDANGGFIMDRHLLVTLFAGATLLLAPAADARSSYDGSWNITFVTQSGDCNPTYNYSVNIENGVITSPNAATFTGNVTSSGAVRASVTVQEKRASGQAS